MDFLAKSIQEIFYFDIWEALFMVSFILIANRIKVAKLQFVFHIFMICVLNYLISSLISAPIVQQIIGVISYSSYFMFVFRLTFMKSLTKNIEVFFIFFIIEVSLAILYKNLLNVELISMTNYNMKFLYMIGFRIVEISYLYIYYKFKGGESHEENSKSFN